MSWVVLLFMVLGIIGIITSGYLLKSHLDTSAAGSFCDITEAASCSIVNSSSFSKLLGVPVAALGILWFVFFMVLMARQCSMHKNKTVQEKVNNVKALFLWNLLGLISVIYLIIGEIIIRAICPLCTIVHIIILLALVYSFIEYKKLTTKDKKYSLTFFKQYKTLLFIFVILTIATFVFFNLPEKETQDYTELTQCVTDNGVSMYGSFRCAICTKTRAMLGDAFENINEIECHPQGENAQTELCLSKGIEATPTWILEPNGPNGEELKRHVGFLTVEELADFAGCQDTLDTK